MMSIHPSICRTPFRASFREKRFARSRLAIATSHILTGLILTGAMVGAAAQAEEVYELGEVVVTAARTSQTVDETLAPVTVINRAQIERSQATDITELLKTVPGLQINRSGGPGSTTSVFMRGASSSQTLVLVDGQRINSATAGMAEFQYINPDQIERIEVVRGPRSSLYGADALGGVIQIFTRKGNGDPRLSVKASAGSRNTHELGVNFGGKSGGKSEGTRFNLGASLYETSGFDVTNDYYAENTGPNLDDDAYRNKSFSGRLSHSFESGVESGISFSHAQGKSEFDGYTSNYPNTYPYDAYTKFKMTTVNAYSIFPLMDAWSTRLDMGYSYSTSDLLGKDDSPAAPYTPSFFETKRLLTSLQNDIEWFDNQLLTVGIDYYKDSVDNSRDYVNQHTGLKEDARYNSAVFIQNLSQFDWSDLQIGLRRDKNESYGYKTTGNFAWGVDLPEDMRVIASYGTGFRAPTFNDLYYPDSSMPGNPNLKPESSKNAEVELRGNHLVGSWSVSVFQNDIDDLIAWAPISPGSYIWTPSNVSEARIRGLEASLSKSFGDWDLNATVTLLDPKDTQKDKVLVRRAKQYCTFDADRHLGKFSVGTTFRAQGHAYEDVNNKDRLGGFATVDIRTSYRVSTELEAQVKAVNLLDKQYQTAKGYNNEPRGIFATLIWTLEI